MVIYYLPAEVGQTLYYKNENNQIAFTTITKIEITIKGNTIYLSNNKTLSQKDINKIYFERYADAAKTLNEPSPQ